MKTSNRYAEYTKTFSAVLMVPCHYYGKLTQPVRGSEEWELFVADYMQTWRKLGLSATPKAHFFEYHTVDSMQGINGLGYNTKDFIDLYH